MEVLAQSHEMGQEGVYAVRRCGIYCGLSIVLLVVVNDCYFSHPICDEIRQNTLELACLIT